MAQWRVWEPSYLNVTLREDGDLTEIEAATRYNLDKAFPKFEDFWRKHVVPATNRPANIDHRAFVHSDYARMTQVSHGVFYDLLKAERALARVTAGDYGGRWETCQDALTHGGNAMQKFTDLQREHIEPMLVNHLGVSKKVWTPAQWTSTWKPRYSKLAAYRNFLTHQGMPQVMLVPQNDTVDVPYVPTEDHFHIYEPLSWPEQQARYGTHPQEWDHFRNVCQRVQRQTIDYLNDAYAEVINLLDPFLTDDKYQDLWGWDTKRYGSHAKRCAQPALAVCTSAAISGTGNAPHRPTPPRPHSGSGYGGLS